MVAEIVTVSPGLTSSGEMDRLVTLIIDSFDRGGMGGWTKNVAPSVVIMIVPYWSVPRIKAPTSLRAVIVS